MAQTATEVSRSDSGSTGRIANVGLWILQIAAAAMFLMVGYFKLSGDPQMVELFNAIGFGQWFRYVTGSVEVWYYRPPLGPPAQAGWARCCSWGRCWAPLQRTFSSSAAARCRPSFSCSSRASSRGADGSER